MLVGIYHHTLPEEQQLSGLQLREMRKTVAANQWKMHRIYEDSTDKNHQPAFYTMLEDAQQHRFDILLFWSLQQLRPGIRSIIHLLNNLSTLKIGIYSCTEPHIDTCHLHKDILVSTFASLAQHDSRYISQRTRVGLKHQQKTCLPGPNGYLGAGRPPIQFDQKRAIALRKKKQSYQQIAVACGISKATVQRFFKSKEEGSRNRILGVHTL